MRRKTQTDEARPTLCHQPPDGKAAGEPVAARSPDEASLAAQTSRTQVPRTAPLRGIASSSGAASSPRTAPSRRTASSRRMTLSPGTAASPRTTPSPRTAPSLHKPRSTPSRGNVSAAAESKRSIGAKFEAHALGFLQRQRLRLVARNVVCRGGEIDLVMRDPDGALVFVEVRARARARYGGALASVGRQKRQRLVRAAQFYLATRSHEAPRCRFDVVAFESGRLVWLRDAFRADDI